MQLSYAKQITDLKLSMTIKYVINVNVKKYVYVKISSVCLNIFDYVLFLLMLLMTSCRLYYIFLSAYSNQILMSPSNFII